MRSKLIAITAVALAVGGCQRPNVDHPRTDYTTSLLSRMSAAEIDAVTVPPAPAERGPIPPNANAADPATNASLAFASGTSSPPTPDNSPDGEHAAVMAEEAAARAPDTATADEAKRRIYAEYAARGSVTANANDAGTNSSTNGSTANGATSNGATSNGATSNGATNNGASANAASTSSAGTQSVGAQSVGAQSVGAQSVGAQTNGSTGSEPMATENFPRPATVDKS
jgi:hypothetical protein